MKNVARINTDLLGLLKKWMAFTKPFHDLTTQEQETTAAVIYQYLRLKEQINNEDILWKMVFDYDIKNLIKKDLNDIEDYSLQNVLSRLRKKGVIENKRIKSTYIPNVTFDTKKYELIFSFNVE